MLYIPNQGPEFSRELDRIISRSTTETTPEGFEYFVASLEDNIGITTGEVYRNPEQTELTLVISSFVARKERIKIAQTAVAAEFNLDKGRYWLAEAVRTNLGWDNDTDFTENIDAINLMLNEVQGQLRSILDDPTVSTEVKRRVKDEGRSAIGMLAAFTGISDTGRDILAEFNSQGLWIPHSDVDSSQLQGFMRTERGTERVRFITMPEKSERHHCANCSGHIIPTTNRVTLSMDKHDGYSDHHHYHFPCFVSQILPQIDPRTLEQKPLRFN